MLIKYQSLFAKLHSVKIQLSLSVISNSVIDFPLLLMHIIHPIPLTLGIPTLLAALSWKTSQPHQGRGKDQFGKSRRSVTGYERGVFLVWGRRGFRFGTRRPGVEQGLQEDRRHPRRTSMARTADPWTPAKRPPSAAPGGDCRFAERLSSADPADQPAEQPPPVRFLILVRSPRRTAFRASNVCISRWTRQSRRFHRRTARQQIVIARLFVLIV